MADVSDYYKVITCEDNLFHVELGGFWSDEVMDKYNDAIQKIFRDSVLSFNGAPIIHFAHWTTTPALGPKAIAHVTESQQFFKAHNGYKVVELIPSSMVKVGLRNAANKSGAEGDELRFVAKDLDDAWVIINKLKEELKNSK